MAADKNAELEAYNKCLIRWGKQFDSLDGASKGRICPGFTGIRPRDEDATRLMSAADKEHYMGATPRDHREKGWIEEALGKVGHQVSWYRGQTPLLGLTMEQKTQHAYDTAVPILPKGQSGRGGRRKTRRSKKSRRKTHRRRR
jgi:hypothetical protein